MASRTRRHNDRDGLKNLIEYALVTNPILSGDHRLNFGLQTYSGNDSLRSVFTRDPARNDITIRVEVASDLAGPWTTVAMSVLGAAMTGEGVVSEIDLADGLKQVEVRDTISTTGSRQRFLKIVIE